VSNLREDGIASGVTDYDGEKYLICLYGAEKKGWSPDEVKLSRGTGGGGRGRYGEQLVYLGSLVGGAVGLLDWQGKHE